MKSGKLQTKTKNWEVKKLCDITEIIMGQSPPSITYNTEGIGLPFFQGKSEFREVYPIPEKFCSKPVRVAETNDILISVRAPVGPVNLAPCRCCIGRGLSAIKANKGKAVQLFLFFFLKYYEKRWSAIGSSFAAIGRSNLENLKILLPPLETQQQIVDRLDAIRKAQELNDKQIVLAEELFQSLLHRELDSKGKNWEVKILKDLFIRQKETIIPAKDYPNEYFNYIGLENIESNSGTLINFSKTIGENIRSSKFRFRKDDILYGKLRPYLNKVFLAEFDGICSTDIWVLKSKTDFVLPFILAIILSSKTILKRTSLFMTGSNLPRVSKEYFDSIKISIPPLEIQREIVEKLQAIQDYKKSLLTQKEKLKELFESVLEKAMKVEILI